MADVRLTATNPEDSSVVPVACDASGRLLLEEQVQGPPGPEGPPGPKGDDGDPFSGNFDGNVTFTGSVTAKPSGTSAAIYAYNGGTSSENAILISDTTDGSGLKTFLKYDGSATFTGNIQATKPRSSRAGSDTGGLCINPSDSTLYFNFRVDEVDNDLRIDTVQGADKIKFGIDGSAEFAGKKAGFTEEGYLWCKTRRGDTVILDSTSNGLGVWEPYTPPSRKQQIKDKLDSIREETGDMPADTQ